MLITQHETKARATIAEAERGEVLARLPPSSIKPPQGSADTRQFGATGLIRAFDPARQPTSEVCDALPAIAKPPSTSWWPRRAP